MKHTKDKSTARSDVVSRAVLGAIACAALVGCTKSFDVQIVSVGRAAVIDAAHRQSGAPVSREEVIRVGFRSAVDILTEASARNVPDVVYYVYPCGGPDQYRHVGPIVRALTEDSAYEFYADVPESWGKLTVSSATKGYTSGWPSDLAAKPLCFQVFGQNTTMSGLVSREIILDGINDLLR